QVRTHRLGIGRHLPRVRAQQNSDVGAVQLHHPRRSRANLDRLVNDTENNHVVLGDVNDDATTRQVRDDFVFRFPFLGPGEPERKGHLKSENQHRQPKQCTISEELHTSSMSPTIVRRVPRAVPKNYLVGAATAAAAVLASASILSSSARSRYRPARKTAAIRCVFAMLSSGLASSRTRSAAFPLSTVPNSRSRPRNSVAPRVAACSASLGVSPARTSSTSSLCRLSPGNTNGSSESEPTNSGIP